MDFKQRKQAIAMAKSNPKEGAKENISLNILTHSDRSLLSLLNKPFEDKEPPRQSKFYRFYWLCCHHPKATIISTPSKLQCLLRNTLLEPHCAKCGHKMCDTCQKVAQRESGHLEEVVVQPFIDLPSPDVKSSA